MTTNQNNQIVDSEFYWMFKQIFQDHKQQNSKQNLQFVSSKCQQCLLQLIISILYQTYFIINEFSDVMLVFQIIQIIISLVSFQFLQITIQASRVEKDIVFLQFVLSQMFILLLAIVDTILFIVVLGQNNQISYPVTHMIMLKILFTECNFLSVNSKLTSHLLITSNIIYLQQLKSEQIFSEFINLILIFLLIIANQFSSIDFKFLFREYDNRFDIQYTTIHDVRNQLFSTRSMIKDLIESRKEEVQINMKENRLNQTSIFNIQNSNIIMNNLNYISQHLKILQDFELIFSGNFVNKIKEVNTEYLFGFLSKQLKIQFQNKTICQDLKMEKFSFLKLKVNEWVIQQIILIICQFYQENEITNLNIDFSTKTIEYHIRKIVQLQVTFTYDQNQYGKEDVEKNILNSWLLYKIMNFMDRNNINIKIYRDYYKLFFQYPGSDQKVGAEKLDQRLTELITELDPQNYYESSISSDYHVETDLNPKGLFCNQSMEYNRFSKLASRSQNEKMNNDHYSFISREEKEDNRPKNKSINHNQTYNFENDSINTKTKTRGNAKNLKKNVESLKKEMSRLSLNNQQSEKDTSNIKNHSDNSAKDNNVNYPSISDNGILHYDLNLKSETVEVNMNDSQYDYQSQINESNISYNTNRHEIVNTEYNGENIQTFNYEQNNKGNENNPSADINNGNYTKNHSDGNINHKMLKLDFSKNKRMIKKNTIDEFGTEFSFMEKPNNQFKSELSPSSEKSSKEIPKTINLLNNTKKQNSEKSSTDIPKSINLLNSVNKQNSEKSSTDNPKNLKLLNNSNQNSNSITSIYNTGSQNNSSDIKTDKTEKDLNIKSRKTTKDNIKTEAFESQLFMQQEKEEIFFESQQQNVDDEKGILRMHERLFKKYALELNTSKTAIETIRKLRSMNESAQFHDKKILMIMDYKLEKETGDEVVSLIQQYSQLYPNLKLEFVALTSTEDQSVENAFQNVGVKKIFIKPLNKKKVEEILSFI